MIVVSGALVLVALVLLLAGLFTDTGLTLVYLSIGVSLVSGAFLVIGVLTRRGEEPAVPANAAVPPPPVPVGASSAPVRPVEPPGAAYAPSAGGRGDFRPPAAPPPPPAAYPEGEYADYDDEYDDDEYDEYDDEDLDPARTIFVVEGRPRYHVEDCRYLDGKDYEPLDVDIALEEGFTPCGVCRPDEALAAYAQADAEEPAAPVAVAPPARRPASPPPPTAPVAAPEPDEDYVEAEYDDVYDDFDDEGDDFDEDEDEDFEDEDEDEDAYVEVPARAEDLPRRSAAVESEVEDYDDDADDDEVAPDPLPPAPVVTRSKPPARSTRAQAAPPAAVRPAGRAQTAALAGRGERATVTAPARPATPAADSSAARSSTVLVIPDRGKYHRAGCRYVRDNADAVERSKAAARRAGYAPCGVCKP